MKNKNGISLKALYTRNRDKYNRPIPKEDLTQSSVSGVSTMINQTSTNCIPHPHQHQYPCFNLPMSYSKYVKINFKEAILNQTMIDKGIEDDSQTQFNTIDSNISISKGLPMKTNHILKTTKCFVPLSKLNSTSIANVSKIIPSIASRRLTKENNALKTKESVTHLPITRKENNNNRNLLNQLVKNEESYIKNTMNQTINDTNYNNNDNISLCNSTITSSSNIPPVSTANNGNNSKGNHHKRELSIISLESTPDIIIVSHEDLLLIEDKLHDILSLIELKNVAHNECFEWWNYYFNSSIAGKYEEYFLNNDNKKKIRSYVNIELLCVMLCYAVSLNKEAFNEYIKEFKAIFSFLHFNLLLIIKMIITKQKGSDPSSAKLSMMIKKSLTLLKENEIDEFFISSLITHNINSVSEQYLNIVDKEAKNNRMEYSLSNFFNLAYENRQSITVDEYNDFFRLNVFKVNNPDGSILASSLIKLNQELQAKPKPKVPFLSLTSKFKYTLVLDLDETLVHYYEYTINDSNQNVNSNDHKLFLRPNLNPFLQKVKKKFELVVFTAGTQEYADNIINIIEKKEHFFSHRLYREHTLVVGNDFIKDLTKLGRDLSKIVIVDNMPQNYRLQKENGIFIKAFFGDNNDSALTHLSDILFKIIKDNGDIRKGIGRYKDDIVTMVSLNKIDKV